MIIKKDIDVEEVQVKEKGLIKVTRRILIGPKDGLTNIVMRYFKVLPGGHTPFHSHAHEHVVKIEKGKGKVIDDDGYEFVVSRGQSLLIEGSQKHQFKNPFQEPFEFLCIIPHLKRV